MPRPPILTLPKRENGTEKVAMLGVTLRMTMRSAGLEGISEADMLYDFTEFGDDTAYFRATGAVFVVFCSLLSMTQGGVLNSRLSSVGPSELIPNTGSGKWLNDNGGSDAAPVAADIQHLI